MAEAQDSSPDERSVLFFDIDNCLYPRSAEIHSLMSTYIDNYFQDHLSLTQQEAHDLHNKYYTQYGLAIEGLVRHHTVDALDFNAKVDDALPLEDILKPDPRLRKLLEDIDRTRVKPWLLTNAYINHGKRVVKLLQVEDLFEGMTYCDYSAKEFLAKPRKEFFFKAMKDAGVALVKNCYFVDDSYNNGKGAYGIGWSVAHLIEPSDAVPAQPACEHIIRSLQELRTIFPQFFKPQVNGLISRD